MQRISIADDHALFRDGLRSLLRLDSDVEVVAETAAACDIEAMLERSACDILLLDLQMERNTLVDIRELALRVQVIVLTAEEDPTSAMDALRAGARAVVFKRFAVDTLLDAIRAVGAGHVWMPPFLQAQILDEFRHDTREPLTRREREIVALVTQGLRNTEVARALFISEQTVKTHLNNVFHKLGIRDRVELTLYAMRGGLGAGGTPRRARRDKDA